MAEILDALNDANNQEIEIAVDRRPDECPHCHMGLEPKFVAAFVNTQTSDLMEAIFRCPRVACRRCFIAVFREIVGKQGYMYIGCRDRTHQKREFSEEIKELSSRFVVIWNEAALAEDLNLNDICGMGYRKALEFLVKDYLIKSAPKEKDAIAEMRLGNCISQKVSDAKLKDCARRAAWLGNDETHYERRWPEKAIPQLKDLIELTLHWIEAEMLTQKYVEEMPTSAS